MSQSVAQVDVGGEGDDDGSLKLAPRRPFVDITEVAPGEFMVSHSLTTERKPLPSGSQWSMEADEDGYGCLFDEGASEDAPPLLAEDLLAKTPTAPTSCTSRMAAPSS